MGQYRPPVKRVIALTDTGPHPFVAGDRVRCHDASTSSGRLGGKNRFLEYNCVYVVAEARTTGGTHLVKLEGVQMSHRATRFKRCHVWKKDEVRPVPPPSLLIKEADPELERLLAEEEEIERSTREWHEQQASGNFTRGSVAIGARVYVGPMFVGHSNAWHVLGYTMAGLVEIKHETTGEITAVEPSKLQIFDHDFKIGQRLSFKNDTKYTYVVRTYDHINRLNVGKFDRNGGSCLGSWTCRSEDFRLDEPTPEPAPTVHDGFERTSTVLKVTLRRSASDGSRVAESNSAVGSVIYARESDAYGLVGDSFYRLSQISQVSANVRVVGLQGQQISPTSWYTAKKFNLANPVLKMPSHVPSPPTVSGEELCIDPRCPDLIYRIYADKIHSVYRVSLRDSTSVMFFGDLGQCRVYCRDKLEKEAVRLAKAAERTQVGTNSTPHVSMYSVGHYEVIYRPDLMTKYQVFYGGSSITGYRSLGDAVAFVNKRFPSTSTDAKIDECAPIEKFKVTYELTNDKTTSTTTQKAEPNTMALFEVTAVLKAPKKKGGHKLTVLADREVVKANSNEHADAILTVRLAAEGKLDESNVQYLQFAHRTLIS